MNFASLGAKDYDAEAMMYAISQNQSKEVRMREQAKSMIGVKIRWRVCASLCFPILFSTAVATGDSWTPTGSLNSERGHHTATLLLSGKVLVTGGCGETCGFLISSELYDPVSGMWTSTGSLNVPRANHTATLLSSGKVLVAGGQNDGGVGIVSAELYDPSTGKWTLTGSFVAGRENHTATLLPSGRVLAAGGYCCGGSGGTNTAELFDPITGVWFSTNRMLKIPTISR